MFLPLTVCLTVRVCLFVCLFLSIDLPLRTLFVLSLIVSHHVMSHHSMGGFLVGLWCSDCIWPATLQLACNSSMPAASFIAVRAATLPFALVCSRCIDADLKSPNLLLDNEYRVKVCDFGWWKRVLLVAVSTVLCFIPFLRTALTLHFPAHHLRRLFQDSLEAKLRPR